MKVQILVKSLRGRRTLNGNFQAGSLSIVFDQQTKTVSEQAAEQNKKEVLTALQIADNAKIKAKDLEAGTTKAEAKKAEPKTKTEPKKDVCFVLPLSREDVRVLTVAGFLGQGDRKAKKTVFELKQNFAVEFWETQNPNEKSTVSVAFLQNAKVLHIVQKKVSDNKHNLFLNTNEYQKAEKKPIKGFLLTQLLAA